MAKKKNSTALFEAISKSKERSDPGLNPPGWIGKDPQGSGEPSGAAQSGFPVLAAGRGGRGIDLSGRGLIVLGVIILVSAAVGFVVGRTTAPSRDGQNTPASGPNRAGASGGPAKYAGGSVGNLPEREVNKDYLVIQRFAGTSQEYKDDANKIADWLWNEKHEPVEVKTLKAGNETFLCVWSLRPFDSYLQPDAVEFAKHIEELGKEYKKISAGKYAFLQRKQGKFEPWYMTYKGPPKP